MKRSSLLLASIVTLAACQPSKPAHYYVLCEDKDGRGWTLTDYEKDAGGYIMSCTYTSPDRQRVEVLRCRDTGCD